MSHADDSPPARHREEAPHPRVVRARAGEFTEGPRYHTWRNRGTTDWLILYTVEGAGRIAGTHRALVTRPGDAVLLRPGARHDYGTAQSRWTLAFAHFHPRAEWMSLLDWPGLADGIGLLHSAGEIRPRVLAALRGAARASTASRTHSELFTVNALESALLWLDVQNPVHGRSDDRIVRVVEHIGSHLADELSLPVLARVAALSPSRLSTLFRETLGTSPQRYVERERLARAAEMLASTPRSVADIAQDAGWNDPLYFSRRFRSIYGDSPTAYRARQTRDVPETLPEPPGE